MELETAVEWRPWLQDCLHLAGGTAPLHWGTSMAGLTLTRHLHLQLTESEHPPDPIAMKSLV